MSSQSETSTSNLDKEKIETIAKIVAALITTRNNPSSDNNSIDKVLQALQGLTTEAETQQQSEATKENPDDPELTSVNRALGVTVGRALNGRKTWLGSVGLLATTLVPIFFPAATPLIEILKSIGLASGAAAETTNPLLPIFSALTGWGILGKIEKWMKK